MDLNYTCLNTGSQKFLTNYYISHLLWEVFNDHDSELMDVALKSTDWGWNKWFYVPDELDDVDLEKLRAEITRGIFRVIESYDELLEYVRWQAQDRRLADYIQLIPREACVLLYYPHL